MPESPSSPSLPGHLRVESRRTGRVWVAKIRRAEGGWTRKVLGPAWVRDTGRRTGRGGPIWRAGDGACPDGHLTPRAAEAALEQLLASERNKPVAASPGGARKTFADATAAWLEYVSAEKELAPSTLRRYRG